MSLSLGDFFKYNPATAIPYALGDKLDVFGTNAEDRLNQYSGDAAAQRAASKNTQYGLLNQMQGPVITPQMENRIKALEDQSHYTLMNDPQFQAQQRQATVGGAQALSAIQNKQAASGASGGFQNVGSIQDVNDRLGVQLAELGQKQNMYRDTQSQQAADARQRIADAQIQYNNSITQAKIAIESGDAKSAQDAMARAYAAREQIQNNTNQMLLGLGSLAIQGVGGMNRAPAAQPLLIQQPQSSYSPVSSSDQSYLNQVGGGNSIIAGDRPYYQMKGYK